MGNMDFSETFGKDGQKQFRQLLNNSDPKGMQSAHKKIDQLSLENLSKLNLNNSFMKNMLGNDDAKELNQAFQQEKKIFSEKGVGGIIDQIKGEIGGDPQKMNLHQYADDMHNTLSGMGIQFDNTQIQNFITGFQKTNLDSLANQVKEKAMKADFKSGLHKMVGKVEDVTQKGIPGMWENLKNGASKNAGEMLSKIGGGNAEAGLKTVLEQHRREVHMSKLEQFYNDSWQHIMMNVVALLILLICLVYLYKKYRAMLKERRKQLQ